MEGALPEGAPLREAPTAPHSHLGGEDQAHAQENAAEKADDGAPSAAEGAGEALGGVAAQAGADTADSDQTLEAGSNGQPTEQQAQLALEGVSGALEPSAEAEDGDGDASASQPVPAAAGAAEPESGSATGPSHSTEQEQAALGSSQQVEEQAGGGAEQPPGGADSGTAAVGDEEAPASSGAGPHAGEQSPAGTGSPAAAAAASLSASPSTRSSRRAAKPAKLTFTSPPKCLDNRPRTAMRSNYSHSQQRVRQILRDNDHLVHRLGQLACKAPAHERDQQKHDKFMANVAASSATRRRVEANRVMQNNLCIYQRLQEVKPSRDVARAEHDKAFAKHEKMLATLAALRAKHHGSWQK